ncbi:hypothetical protein [Synechocystis sp. PCC 6714]|uniref:hypothetical protein n=1 Tax=Synechocystis sp. (strain PCC 6714) TaxID=1147 RepID=UPI000425D60C|nr:hypothetical protein [Synechocystis sp. PCC 6714]AIE76151.1 hypothetical protein D082_41050 [Synechocystis sp. PCC 6714]
MTAQPLTAEFAIEQLKILCQDGDVSEAFPNFDKSSYDYQDIRKCLKSFKQAFEA